MPLSAACARLQASLRLDQPPLLAAGLFWLGAARGARLLLVAHHLVIDGVSWRILLDDLRLGLGQAQQAQPVRLPPRSVSFDAAGRLSCPSWPPARRPDELPGLAGAAPARRAALRRGCRRQPRRDRPRAVGASGQ